MLFLLSIQTVDSLGGFVRKGTRDVFGSDISTGYSI